MSEIQFEDVLVTPKRAAAWLRNNPLNRKISEESVDKYTRDMLNGDWTFNGETVKIATDGSIIDGQHRFEAVVRSGKSVRMLAVLGLPPETRETVDTGRSRSVSDVLGMREETYARIIPSIVRLVWHWQRGERAFRSTVNSPTVSETIRFLQEFPQIRRSAEISSRTYNSFRYMPQSILGTAHFLFNEVAPDAVPWFFQRYADGAELPAEHPILTLRNRVIRDRVTEVKSRTDRSLFYIVRTWNAYRNEESLARLIYEPGKLLPEPR